MTFSGPIIRAPPSKNTSAGAEPAYLPPSRSLCSLPCGGGAQWNDTAHEITQDKSRVNEQHQLIFRNILRNLRQSWLKSCILKKEAPFVISFPCVKGQDCDWLFFLPEFFQVCQAISWVGLRRAHKCCWAVLAAVLLIPPSPVWAAWWSCCEFYFQKIT